jgi:AhpD family alkylhydroperoxidase
MKTQSLTHIDPALDLMTEFGKLTGHTTRHVNQMRQDTIFSDGVLPARIKVLAAVLWSISARCEPCIKFYVQRAAGLGVTENELGEMLAVASTMGGCVGEMWALKAFKAYHDFTSDPGVPATELSCC